MSDIEIHDSFYKKMSEKYPRYCGQNDRFGGFAIGEGWYHIIEQLLAEIDHYTKWRRNMRANDLKKLRAMKKGRDALIQFMAGKRHNPTEWDIERADHVMANGVDVTPKFQPIRIEQVKEKFGGLRFYFSGGNDEISGMVRMAELWAGNTCETCGNKGERRSGGWVRTLCDTHEEEYQNKWKNMKDEDDE